MHLSRLSLASLLALSPLLSRAQAADKAPRYYVGLAAYSSAYQKLGGGAYQSTRLPFQVAVGYQLRPRLAVQLGVAYSQQSYDYSFNGNYSPGVGLPDVYSGFRSQGTEHTMSGALLARYTLTRQPAHRLQADVLGGFTVVANRYSASLLQTDSSRTPATIRYAHSGTDFSYLLTAGASVRYRLGQRLEALLDFTLNYDIDREHHAAVNTSEVTGATALGLRYRFGK